MNNKQALAMVLAAVLSFSALAGLQFIRSAAANFLPIPTPLPAVFIRSDGDVEPLTAPIQREGKVYTFTNDIVGYTLVVECDNIVIDGAGYTLQGKGNAAGIFLQERSNIAVRNMVITNFSRGIMVTAVPTGLASRASKNDTFSGNTIINNTDGILITGSSGNHTISGNIITANSNYGIWLAGRGGCVISGNQIANNGNGISCVGSNYIIGNSIIGNDGYGLSIEACDSNNILRNNNMIGNRYNFNFVVYNVLGSLANDIDTSNTVDGKPIYHWVNQQNKNVPLDAGYVALMNCSRIMVQNLNLSNNGQGLLLISTIYSTITENLIANNRNEGIHVLESSENTIYHNNFVNNGVNGTRQTYTCGKKRFFGDVSWRPGDPNFWDKDSEGNYWSDYVTKYPNATESDRSGIWNTPYSINANNIDHYPLMKPFAISPSPPLLAMPEEYINYTITRVNGTLWAKVDGTYPIHKVFGAGDVFKLDGTKYMVVSDELPLVYPTPPGTTNISVKLNETELSWSNYTETYPEALHHTAIGDWPMIYCMISQAPKYFTLKIHYEHPLAVANGNYLFLYDLNISPYLSPWSSKSTAFFSIRMETDYKNLQAYTTGSSNEARNPVDYTTTKEDTAETIIVKITSEYDDPLPGDLIITFTDPEAPNKQPGFLGSSLPMEYGYAIAAAIVVATASITIYLYHKRRK